MTFTDRDNRGGGTEVDSLPGTEVESVTLRSAGTLIEENIDISETDWVRNIKEKERVKKEREKAVADGTVQKEKSIMQYNYGVM